jgi:hypothetical protein
MMSDLPDGQITIDFVMRRLSSPGTKNILLPKQLK